MRSIWKSYFSHPTVLLLFVGFAASLYGVTTLQLWDQWGWIFLIIAIAPFYEWVTHKYVLHQELTPKPGWKRDFQIRLHHGHHLHAAPHTASPGAPPRHTCSTIMYLNDQFLGSSRFYLGLTSVVASFGLLPVVQQELLPLHHPQHPPLGLAHPG